MNAPLTYFDINRSMATNLRQSVAAEGYIFVDTHGRVPLPYSMTVGFIDRGFPSELIVFGDTPADNHLALSAAYHEQFEYHGVDQGFAVIAANSDATASMLVLQKDIARIFWGALWKPSSRYVQIIPDEQKITSPEWLIAVKPEFPLLVSLPRHPHQFN